MTADFRCERLQHNVEMVTRENSDSESRQPSLTQYFSQNSSVSSPEATFFDQISSGPSAIGDSAMMRSMHPGDTNLDLFASDQTSANIPQNSSESQLTPTSVKHSGPAESKEEPVICRIFSETAPAAPVGPNVFDLFTSLPAGSFPVSTPVGGAVIAMDLGLSGSQSSNILNSNDLSLKESSSQYYPLGLSTVDSGTAEESFTKTGTIRPNEADRRRDAWIPSETTRSALIKMATSAQGSYIPEKDLLTMPGVSEEEDLPDPIHHMMQHYFNDSEATKRKVLSVGDVTQDERGLQELIQAGCYHAAVNLTSKLLTIYGQGYGRAGHPSKHTTRSIQLWFTRLALLVKLRRFEQAEREGESFGDLDRPDLYYPFYPDLYGGRMGTLVPFGFRLVLAELPQYVNRHREALSRLFSILAVIKKILNNLNNGLSEEGCPAELSPSDVAESKKLWSSREIRVLHSIVNCALATKKLALALEVLERISNHTNDLTLKQQRALQSALGRLQLQLGDVVAAERHFAISHKLRQQQTQLSESKGILATRSTGPDLRELVDLGLLAVSQGIFQEASELFQKASELDPGNIMVVNNMAVCQLYHGRLNDALSLLESALSGNPTQGLHEAVLLNMCTLFELESSHCKTKKLGLLRMLARYKGDGVAVSCLKLQIN